MGHSRLKTLHDIDIPFPRDTLCGTGVHFTFPNVLSCTNRFMFHPPPPLSNPDILHLNAALFSSLPDSCQSQLGSHNAPTLIYRSRLGVIIVSPYRKKTYRGPMLIFAQFCGGAVVRIICVIGAKGSRSHDSFVFSLIIQT